jgi:hypothetical protein
MAVKVLPMFSLSVVGKEVILLLLSSFLLRWIYLYLIGVTSMLVGDDDLASIVPKLCVLTVKLVIFMTCFIELREGPATEFEFSSVGMFSSILVAWCK